MSALIGKATLPAQHIRASWPDCEILGKTRRWLTRCTASLLTVSETPLLVPGKTGWLLATKRASGRKAASRPGRQLPARKANEEACVGHARSPYRLPSRSSAVRLAECLPQQLH